MGNDKTESVRRRQAAQRARERAVGVVSVTVKVPVAGKPGLLRAAALMRQGIDPAIALHQAGGSNDPGGEADAAELAAAREQVEELRVQRNQFQDEARRLAGMLETEGQAHRQERAALSESLRLAQQAEQRRAAEAEALASKLAVVERTAAVGRKVETLTGIRRWLAGKLGLLP